MDIEQWLVENDLARFTKLFADNEIDYDVLDELAEADLTDIGIPLGARKKILKAIRTTVGVSAAKSGTGGGSSGASAERRQLTVMFVDLVGSTALSEKLDPEEMREIITAFQNAVAGAVTRFDGQVAKYMGDGVLCYFGWPRAHEDDAERAVRAGRGVIDGLSGLTNPTGAPVQARVGIATGLVVVGDLIGEGTAQEEAVVGDTPNLAARLQERARPNQVLVAEATRMLLGELFDFEILEELELKGISGKTSVFFVSGERSNESRFQARSSGELSAMVGRDHELALMAERWARAKASEGQLVLLTGEAGVGKSRIAQAMIASVEAEPHNRLNFQCSPYHTDSSFYPTIQQLTRAAGINQGDSNDDQIDKLEAVLEGRNVALLGNLMGLDTSQRFGPLDMTPEQQRSQTLQALVDQMVALSKERPVLFAFEDAHWIDPSSLELLDLCLDFIANERVLLLVTARPTFDHGFGGHPIVTKLALNRLGREQVDAIAQRIAGNKTLPAKLVEVIAEKTDGVPLFVEELTKTVLESGDLAETDTSWVLQGPLNRLAIPSTLHDSLMARLDRLQPVKEIAQIAACIGRQFDFSTLESISPLGGELLEDALNQLVAAELMFRRGVATDAVYIFKHALVRDAAYESLLKTRRQAIHGKLLDGLEAAGSAAPELLAHHAEQSGQLEKAILHWRAAGEVALSRPATSEAIGHFTAAARLVGQIEDSEAWQEFALELQIQLGSVYLSKDGYGSTKAAEAYRVASALLDNLVRPDLVVPVGYGRWIGHYFHGQHFSAHDVAGKLVHDAKHLDDPVALSTAHRMLSASLLAIGKLAEARNHLETALEHYHPDLMSKFSEQFAHEPGVIIRGFLTLDLLLLGHADQAAKQMAKAQKAVKQLGHLNTSCYAAWHWSLIGLLSRNEKLWSSWNSKLVDLSSQHGLLTWQSFSRFGELLLQSKAGDQSAPQHLAGEITAYTDRGDWLMIPFYMVEKVREHIRHGQIDEAVDAHAQALAAVERTGESWCLAELHRLNAEIQLAQLRTDEAEETLMLAIEVARAQSAKLFELRSACSLAHLRYHHGRPDEANSALLPVYEWFSEGFDSEDLREAKSVLDLIG